jgi:hypothetical protein
VYIISYIFALLEAKLEHFECLFVVGKVKELSCFSIVDPAICCQAYRGPPGPLGGSRDGSGLAAIVPRSCA